MVLQILANVLASQNREKQAADLLEYILVHEPDNSEVLRALCGVLLMLEQYEAALATVERYERSTPLTRGADDLLLVKSQALWELGQAEKATSLVGDYIARRASS